MAKNEYLKRRDAQYQAMFNAGLDIGTQKMFDIMCLVLNDPDVMGKDTLGNGRLRIIHQAVYEKEKQYCEAWGDGQEADYYQEKL